MIHKKKLFLRLLLLLFVTFSFCEFLIYYLVISSCSWPELKQEGDDDLSNTTVKAMFLADTHLLGPAGHWFDKMRREWQMHTAFQSAITLYRPEVVFFLGDLFDEGLWADKDELLGYQKKFFSLFEVPENTSVYIIPGNHDLGFHYELFPYQMHQFEKIFNTSNVKLVSIKDNHFVLINSMAMEGDGCYFCLAAEKKIIKVAGKLRCAKDKIKCKKKTKLKSYSRPIVLQHFPMYRKSDSVCNERDEAPPEIKNEKFEPKWDCISKKASEMIFDKLEPRLVLSGHTHHGCHVVHREDIHEYTLSSFNWRNKKNPTFILAKIAPTSYAIEKCDIPNETTVIIIYTIFFFVALGSIICSTRRRKTKIC